MVNIFLVGFMGAGKTSVGEMLAKRTGAVFRDLDEAVSRRFGMPVAEIFSRHGEAVFREAESRELDRLAGREGLVVATGGGAFACEGNRRIIDNSGGISVFLDLPWHVLSRRLEDDNRDRPKYLNPDQARSLYEERLPLYRRAAVTISLAGTESPVEVADQISEAVAGVPCGT